MKKIFIISLGALVVTLLFLGIYNFAFKKEQTNNDTKNSANNSTAKTEAKTKKAIAVTSDKVLGATYDKKNRQILYYSAVDGTAWKADEEGKNVLNISSTKLDGLVDVSWAPDHTKVLTEMQKDGQKKYFEYDYKLQKGTTLKSGLDNAVWDNIGVKIFYKYYDQASGLRTLNIANPDGSQWQKLDDIKSRNLSIQPIPLTSFIAYWNYPDANEETSLMTVNSIGGQLKQILTGRYGADYLWSPDGSQALVSSSANKGDSKISLGIVTMDGKYSDLNVATLASKCVWSADNKNVYCAIPNEIPASYLMPNDYLSNKFNTKDSFWKIDTVTGKKEKIEIDDSTLDVTNPFLSQTENLLYLTNRVDQKLYRIDLGQ